ncbi:TetR family transcriptional regulator [Mesorhizobium sp. L-8-10]|uniref:TetR/AcrR family transcriptional regulator n=1 Tax=unclassified Mesorhizobium TaxID=325217 RepID=UPI0019294BAF|nr:MULTISPECIES: TetR/AcrR family transcriptional regulator [unclassified Mesorhizobium]BCH25283.1 TetR family transcriptional regulator [Mesorhizobium sp. L-8-3]BCH33293.1 TetR family transcriptional regulator [Mesorhizobium sp. L-8-10]
MPEVAPEARIGTEGGEFRERPIERIGEPRRWRNAERTRADLLEIATEEFAEKGFAGARVDEIVRRCGVTKNVLYHYFESKERLFVEVMELAYARMRKRQNEWSFADLEPKDAMAKLTIFTFEHFRDEPQVIRLLNSENLHKAKHIAMSGKIPDLYHPLIAAIRDVLAKGRAAGQFRADVDPVDLYITISGLSYFYLSNQYTLGYVLRQDLMAPERLKQREKHMVDVVLGYLRA